MRSCLIATCLLLAACSPSREPAIETGVVTAKNASVRSSGSSSSRTLSTLNTGDEVEILERSGTWFRIRKGETVEGWMDASTLLTKAMSQQMEKLAAAARALPVQNTATVRDAANLRMEPGRATAVIRRLESGQRVEVLKSGVTPRPGTTDARDLWLHVRTSPDEAGWLLSNLVDFDVPDELGAYTEERTYTAVQILRTIDDPTAGSAKWYLVGERTAKADARIDFDGIRVFTWSTRNNRHETAFRLTGIRGVYPISVSGSGDKRSFQFDELSQDFSVRTPRFFDMNGVIVRERRKAKP